MRKNFGTGLVVTTSLSWHDIGIVDRVYDEFNGVRNGF
jgi:hypothetical protein